MSETWAWSDAAPAPALEGGYFGRIIGLCDSGTKEEMLNPQEGSLSYWTLSSQNQAAPMAVIAHIESGLYGENDPAAFYYVLTESGRLWKFILYTKDDGKSYTLEREELGETGLDLSDVSSRSGGTSASLLYDGDTGYLLVAAYTEDAKRFNYVLVHGSKPTYGRMNVGRKEGADPTVVVVPTVPDLSGCGDPEICPRSAVKKAYQNKYPTDAFIIYPDGRHYLAINTFEWLEDEKLIIYVDQGPEEQAFETFFKTCYATK